MTMELEQLHEENDRLRSLVATLLERLGKGEGALSPEIAEAVPVVDLSAQLAGELGEAYQVWCRAASPLVSRAFMFERALRDRIPEARVSALYRQGSRFSSTARGEAEYWRVDVEGSTYLLPQPLSRDQFREVDTLAFEVHPGVSPVAITGCRAALLVPEGGTHGVAVRGDLR